MQTWFDFERDIIDAATDHWHDHLRLCMCAGGANVEHMFRYECSFILFIRTFYETLNVI